MRLKMKILLVHNYYQIGGGEDTVVEQERDLLSTKHEVHTLFVNNSDIRTFYSKFRLLFSTRYSLKSKVLMEKTLKEIKPDVVHVHNTFPLLSPSIFDACHELGVPVVMTLHNYRIVCPTATLALNGKICEKSLSENAYWAVKERVYRGSRVATFVLANMIEYHKRRGTWNNKVDRFIALTQFSKRKFVEAGIEEKKIIVKPNFMNEPNQSQPDRKQFVLFVGRLTKEKGIEFLLDAWKEIPTKLIVVGENQKNYSDKENIEFVGLQNRDKVLKLISTCRFLVVPSLWYEGFPMVILEAFSRSTPVLCSNFGSLAEVVDDGVNGLHFKAGDVHDFREKATALLEDHNRLKIMGSEAKKKFIINYIPETNLQVLEDTYVDLIEKNRLNRKPLKSTILNMNVDVVDFQSAKGRIEKLASSRKSAYVCVSNVHMCMESFDDPEFYSIVNNADLVIPDGRPLYWAQKLLGFQNAQQVRGADIMKSICEDAHNKNLRIGLYGGSNKEVLSKVVKKLLDSHPNLKVVYKYSPPFRKLTKEENDSVVKEINDSGVNILFVGIGCPKQERWMASHVDSLNCTMLGVGAAFDFISGSKKDAPRIVQKMGFEWMFRLLCEPKRLWRRYLKQNPRFLMFFIKQCVLDRHKNKYAGANK